MLVGQPENAIERKLCGKLVNFQLGELLRWLDLLRGIATGKWAISGNSISRMEGRKKLSVVQGALERKRAVAAVTKQPPPPGLPAVVQLGQTLTAVIPPNRVMERINQQKEVAFKLHCLLVHEVTPEVIVPMDRDRYYRAVLGHIVQLEKSHTTAEISNLG